MLALKPNSVETQWADCVDIVRVSNTADDGNYLSVGEFLFGAIWPEVQLSAPRKITVNDLV
jgi:hypothetical protein